MNRDFTAGQVLNGIEAPRNREQKIIPIEEAFREEPRPRNGCCCENKGKPYMLEGRRVVSFNPGCHVHSDFESKWAGRRIGVEG